jgi:hypothetical protein
VASSCGHSNEAPNSLKCASLDENILGPEEGRGSMDLAIRTCLLK